jgi:Gamma-glutamyl cyclotransferase, AIG2-like
MCHRSQAGAAGAWDGVGPPPPEKPERALEIAMEDAEKILLFSYGTLQLESVQLSSFGRILAGRHDAMPGFRKDLVEITDPDVLAKSGERFHPIVIPTDDPSEKVDGMVFEITAAELAAADRYEVSDYKRVEVVLCSGLRAWVYVKA